MIRLYIFDLDGTLANIDHRLHHVRGKSRKERNWKAFNEEVSNDTPNWWVVDLLDMVKADGGEVLILSGRSEENGTQERTEAWLDKYNIIYDHLRMRQAGDYRKDEIIKKEMLEAFLKEYPEYKVWFIVDDRQRVVDMWRENGYNVLQCNAWEEDVDWGKIADQVFKALKEAFRDANLWQVAHSDQRNKMGNKLWRDTVANFLKENFKVR